MDGPRPAWEILGAISSAAMTRLQPEEPPSRIEGSQPPPQGLARVVRVDAIDAISLSRRCGRRCPAIGK